MCQMRVRTGDAPANLERARGMIADVAARGCHLALLPECLDLGWTCHAARSLAQPIPGSTSAALCQAARESAIHVVAGLTERAGSHIYNAALLISPAGEILLKHRKINELDIAAGLYSTGGSLAVAESPLGMLGVNICADNFPNSLALGHTLARMGCQVLLSPCAWAVDADHDNAAGPYGGLWLGAYSTLARLYDITVAGVSNVGWLDDGPWKGRKCIGCSLAIGPGGRVIAQGPYGDDAEALIVAPIEIRAPLASGTRIAEVLSTRGYDGP